jgi:hypothetical protein
LAAVGAQIARALHAFVAEARGTGGPGLDPRAGS